jgi:glycine hydroxymethyltransferase
LRTEAGLPLYGHEMGGELNLGVAEAGFAPYVKIYKPWFIGRLVFMERERSRDIEVIRFRISAKGVRMVHPGDLVLEKHGKVIGRVTSCAIDQEGFLTGQACVEKKYKDENIELFIYQTTSQEPIKIHGELIPGDKVILPCPAVVVSRFLK